MSISSVEQFPGLPGWRRASCLGCTRTVTAARHAHVLIAGRRDGTGLVIIGLKADRALAEEVDAVWHEPMFLLGVAHRTCADRARRVLRSGEVTLPPLLPELTAEELDELPEQFDQPPAVISCPFCGREEERLTVEHVWPQWVSRAMRKRAGVADHDRPFLMPGAQRQRKARLIDVTAPICASCNNRWLATLEQDAERLLSPIVIGQPRILSDHDQAVVATWAVKTALMFDLSSGSEAIIPLGFYRDLAQRRAPHPNMRVWIAAYGGSRPAWARREALWIDTPQEKHPNAVAITFLAGALVFQVFSHFAVSASVHDGRWQFAQTTCQICGIGYLTQTG